MLFVPVVVPPRPSPRAEELSRRLKEAIDQYSILHPDLSAEEIRQAALLAAAGRGRQKQAVALAVVAAVMLTAVLGALVSNGGAGIDERFILPGIILVVGVVLAVVMLYLKTR